MLPKLGLPLMDDQVPEECVAGGTRVAAGSGSKGTCVTCGHPPETWVIILFPAGFSCSLSNQRVQWHSGLVWFHAVPRLPALRAVVR
jgi:hypothetical protein